MEEWKDIQDYEGLYAIGSDTTVKSLEKVIIRENGRTYHVKEKILKQSPSTGGYLKVTLSKNGVQESKHVHKLVAQAFIPNPNGYDTVHHINHDKTDNRIENLEWVDEHEHQTMHGDERGEQLSKTVYQLEGDDIVNIWSSTNEAARQLGFNQGCISACCRCDYLREGNNVYKNYIWSYSPLA